MTVLICSVSGLSSVKAQGNWVLSCNGGRLFSNPLAAFEFDDFRTGPQPSAGFSLGHELAPDFTLFGSLTYEKIRFWYTDLDRISISRQGRIRYTHIDRGVRANLLGIQLGFQYVFWQTEKISGIAVGAIRFSGSLKRLVGYIPGVGISDNHDALFDMSIGIGALKELNEIWGITATGSIVYGKHALMSRRYYDEITMYNPIYCSLSLQKRIRTQ